MKLKATRAALLAVLLAAPALMQAQFNFKVENREVDVHSFASQGFAYSDNNNYLTMDTSKGSGAFTDFGVNVSSSLTDKLRVGAQFYDQNLGQLGNWHPQLDWAFVDYKFADWFGIRAGKIKTVLGLYNDTQDMSFLHTWALLPQSTYPLDLRSLTIAHVGGDIYGHVGLKRAGNVSYTVYGGKVFEDKYGGHYFSVPPPEAITYANLATVGADARWETPITGLTVGTSIMHKHTTYEVSLAPMPITVSLYSNPNRITSEYGEYVRGNWHFAGELRQNAYNFSTYMFGQETLSNQSGKAWFASAAYRVNKRLELGTYHSRLYLDASQTPSDPASDHIFDQAVTARIDLTKFWNVKVEEHFMRGYGDMYTAQGFYGTSNPQGLKPATDMLVVRTGFFF